MTDRATSPPTGPQVQDHEILDRDDIPLFVRGRLLGFASSQSNDHQYHEGEFARPGNRCSACRWFECRIFEVTHELSETCTCPIGSNADDRPSVLKLQQMHAHGERYIQDKGTPLETSVPADFLIKSHETSDCGLILARKPFLVLTYGLSDVPGEVDKRRASWTDSAFEIIEFLTQRGREDRQAFLPAASARALAQAAKWSDEVRAAYIDRAVV